MNPVGTVGNLGGALVLVLPAITVHPLVAQDVVALAVSLLYTQPHVHFLRVPLAAQVVSCSFHAPLHSSENGSDTTVVRPLTRDSSAVRRSSRNAFDMHKVPYQMLRVDFAIQLPDRSSLDLGRGQLAELHHAEDELQWLALLALDAQLRRLYAILE